MSGKKCGQCDHFIGAGDWSLCCTEMHWLTYDLCESCDKFVQAETCRNVSSKVGGFFCSICGENGRDSIVRDMRCPGCGNEVVGAIFRGQLGWRDA